MYRFKTIEELKSMYPHAEGNTWRDRIEGCFVVMMDKLAGLEVTEDFYKRTLQRKVQGITTDDLASTQSRVLDSRECWNVSIEMLIEDLDIEF